MSRVVVALGGNALLRRGDSGSIEGQRRNLLVAARALVELEGLGHELVLTHGNGPQVGYLAIEAEAARDIVPPPPLDVLVAESQGQIGYLLAQALGAQLSMRGRDRRIVAVVTQTVVDPADPAFGSPSKPIGPTYDEATARGLAAEQGWTVAQDGAGWRRVVASPRPVGIVEADSVRALVDDGTLVIAAGGGGVPVALGEGGGWVGVEAVVDKDLAAVVLAEAVGAAAILFLTDVSAVHDGWGTPSAHPLRSMSVAAAEEGVRDGSYPRGSMGPKVEAALTFVRETGGLAAIGALGDAVGLLEGRAGTRIVTGPVPVESSRSP
jgi:carbamate kinase